MASPVEQFKLKPLVPLEIGGVDLSFTQSSLWMVIAVAVATVFLTAAMRGRSLVPGRWQSMAELSYEFVANMLRENVGSEGRKYFPFVFSLFMFILTANLLGMIPGAYTSTSQIIVTFAMAFVVFIGVTVIGLARHGLHFFSLFFPTGAPVYMAPILVPIEIISYFVRPISLSVRLFANMMAGHTMLKVFGSFVVALGIFGVAPMVLIVALMGLEILVAFLQAYVFTILTCLYLNDAINLH
ncbi:MAG: F0F1 ATP synthase subunit A [Rhodospirillaceae bacterium]|nr:F0F1 ATP synthase subunit A [Rhodospirillaceae bacterium]MBT6139810.1 F0F1 ATP synthase subunit A [Rhodospirillaceae bacterium]